MSDNDEINDRLMQHEDDSAHEPAPSTDTEEQIQFCPHGCVGECTYMRARREDKHDCCPYGHAPAPVADIKPKAATVTPRTPEELGKLIGSCRCLTKTPDIQYHDPYCPYRLLSEQMDLQHDLATSQQRCERWKAIASEAVTLLRESMMTSGAAVAAREKMKNAVAELTKAELQALAKEPR